MTDFPGEIFTNSSTQGATISDDSAQIVIFSGFSEATPDAITAEIFLVGFTYLGSLPAEVRAKTWSPFISISSESIQTAANKYYPPNPERATADAIATLSHQSNIGYTTLSSVAIASTRFTLPQGTSLSHRFKMRAWIPSLSQFEYWYSLDAPTTTNPSTLPYTPDSLSVTVVHLPRDGITS